MPRSANQKQKLLVLKQYLEQHTDEQHPVSTAQLIRHLSEQGIAAERKSLYDDLETLSLFGLDVERRREGNLTLWYLGQRDFQLPELRLLVDSVQSSRFITRKKSLELIGKIEKLTSVHQARGLRRQVWVKNRIKAMNESIYYLVDELDAAIANDRRIKFHYFQYDAARQRQLRRGGSWYELSPYALMWDNENYYLVGYDSATQDIRHFRVDKMLDVTDNGGPRDGREAFARLDMAAYTNAHFGMFSGTPVPVKLEFKNHLAGAVIDRFGPETMLLPAREGTFTVTVSAAVTAPFFGWLCSFGAEVRLLSPESAVREMARYVGSVAALYQSE